MAYIGVATLSFEKGYHVGWREARRIIDHTTLFRALLHVAHLTGSGGCAEKLLKGGLEASALLPALPAGKEVRLLAPFPGIPCLGKATRIRGLYLTITTLRELLAYISQCLQRGGTPVARESKLGSVIVDCTGAPAQSLELARSGSLACFNDECKALVPYALEELYVMVAEYRNRIDRMSGAADLFETYGYKPLTPHWLVFRGDRDAVECGFALLEILQRFGLGGLRSRGWGRFKLSREVAINPGDHEVLATSSGWRRGVNYTLGLMTPGEWVDLERTFATREVVMGRSGPSNNEYKLPVVYAMDVGSIVSAREIPSPRVLSLAGGAVMIFNPVVVHA
jgi:hypothetical protein